MYCWVVVKRFSTFPKPSHETTRERSLTPRVNPCRLFLSLPPSPTSPILLTTRQTYLLPPPPPLFLRRTTPLLSPLFQSLVDPPPSFLRQSSIFQSIRYIIFAYVYPQSSSNIAPYFPPPVKTIPYFRTNYQETTLYSATLFINFNNVAGSARISSAEASRQVSRNGNNPLRGTRVLEMDGWKLRTRVRIVDFGSGRARYRVQTFACSCPRLPVKGRETKQSIERPGNVVIVTRRSTAVTRWPHCGR